jgi:hypothetical protein
VQGLSGLLGSGGGAKVIGENAEVLGGGGGGGGGGVGAVPSPPKNSNVVSADCPPYFALTVNSPAAFQSGPDATNDV